MSDQFGIKKLGKRDAERRGSRPSRDSGVSHAKWLASKHPVFMRACELAKVTPSVRQVSKWRRGVGKARRYMTEAIEQLAAEAKEPTHEE